MNTAQENFTEAYNNFGIVTNMPIVYAVTGLEASVPDIVSSSVSPTALLDGNTTAQISSVTGFFQSSNFKTGSTGWRIDSNGNAEFNSGIFRGALSAASIDIPNVAAINSFHTDTSGNSWWGATTFAAAPAKISNTGAATFTSLVINGGQITTNTITANKMSVSQLSAIAADLGTITAGTVTGAVIRTAASGARLVFDSSNYIQAYDSSVLRVNLNTTSLSFYNESGTLYGTIAGLTSAGAGVNISSGDLLTSQNVSITRNFWLKWGGLNGFSMSSGDGSTIYTEKNVTPNEGSGTLYSLGASGAKWANLWTTHYNGSIPLAGTKVYFVANSSGGAVTRRLTFTDGILTSET